MLSQIAQVTGFPFVPGDNIVESILLRIKSKLPKHIDVNGDDFNAAVIEAEKAVNAEGEFAFAELVKQIITPPPPKQFKIKSVLKGKRIDVPAANGVRFSYGPVWTEACLAVSGIAINDYNRPKLNHRALMAGIENPEDMDVVELCTLVADVIRTEMENENV